MRSALAIGQYQSRYTDRLDRFWDLYLSHADKSDKTLMESWKGDTDGILIFVRLCHT